MAKQKKPRNKKRTVNLAFAKSQFMMHLNAGRNEDALKIPVDLIRSGVKNSNVFSDAALASLRLERWADVLSYAQQAYTLDPKNISALDALPHAHWALKQWDQLAQTGRRALVHREKMMEATPPVDLPMAQVRDGGRYVIAFSLFGDSSKYCETAILNACEQPRIYPGWVCRFYVDDTVPDFVVARLADAGGEIIQVDEQLSAWPAPMWRFAAYDADDVERVIFRDADSVISEREAGAVREWIESERGFHAMRDSGSHTELLLAGLWGVKKGALPDMGRLVAQYLEKPVKNAHFADQFFLRELVWPFAREDLLQHDSVFGFRDGRPFPDGPRRDDFHVGYAEGSAIMTIQSSQPNGSTVDWVLIDKRSGEPQEICRYKGQVRAGKVIANIPARYGQLLNSGDMIIRLEAIT